MRKNKVRDLQIKLYYAAKQTLDRKFGALYDKVYREDVLWMAWKKVRSNKGAPGIDEQSFEMIEKEVGVVLFLKGIQRELREQTYRPKASKRCWIEKPGKREKRPLAIPVIKDRVVQMATKLVIGPIFETNFLDCSWGFRPKRSAKGALKEVDKAITFDHKREVIDADIKGCYDNIRHDILIELIQRRINDRRVIKLIKSWLRAGVMEGGEVVNPDDIGTPQGGVISPLLANIYLHSFDKMFAGSGIQGTLVRYADDFVVLVKRDGQEVMKRVKRMFGRLGLELNEEKTKVTRAEEGFDFLGMHIRLLPNRRKGAKLKKSCFLWPSDRSMKRIREKVKKIIGRRYGKKLEEIIEELNPVLRGWNNYYTVINMIKKRKRKLNGFVRERLRIFLKRKYSDQSRGAKRVSDNLVVRLGVYQFT